MTEIYYYHRIKTRPRRWRSVADRITTQIQDRLTPQGGKLYGIWQNQIGRPRDELNVITVFENDHLRLDPPDELFDNMNDVIQCQLWTMQPTLRPKKSHPPVKQGNYAFLWFELPVQDWTEFLQLCSEAWPDFESNYDSQVVGLWHITSKQIGNKQALLLTRRPGLAMWEQSKIPRNQTEQNVRNKLSRRYDLCDFTMVYTTTLFTAQDIVDRTRWT